MKSKDFDADRYAVALKESADEAFDGAEMMLRRKRNGFALFWAHAALQRKMAVIICKETRKMPPWRKDLIRLARFANLKLTKEQRTLCRTLNFYHVEGLYPGLHYLEPSKKEAKELLFHAKEFASSLPNPLAENRKGKA